MKRILIFFFLISTTSFAQKPFAVVELFTSEGSSDCPPAEALLHQIKADAEKNGQNIITLAYHVDYWNKNGWKDPFSKFQFTVRQENYSRVLPGKEVYTPHAIVNGKYECVGSRKDELQASIKKAISSPAKLSITVKQDSVRNDTLFISYTLSQTNPDYVIRIVLAEDNLSSKVTKGENEGKTLQHQSVVRTLFSVDRPLKNGRVNIRSSVFTGKGKKRIVAFVQAKRTMEILAAVSIDYKPI